LIVLDGDLLIANEEKNSFSAELNTVVSELAFIAAKTIDATSRAGQKTLES